MHAIHVNWTKPYFDKARLLGPVHNITRSLTSKTYDQPDYQIFYTILSAMYWKMHNGPIKLYTDSIGLTFLQQFNMSDLYDEIDINFLNGYSKTGIDAARFWTSGKVKCLAHQTKPFVFLDQDMIIREPLPERLFNKDLVVTHWEIPRGNYYFDKEDWERDIPDIEFPGGYSCNDLAPNTSFLMFNNLELLQKYTKWHKKLVEVDNENIPMWYWLLSDQGILGHVVRENDYKVNTLTDKIFLACHNYGTQETLYKGQAGPWYYPSDRTEETKTKEFNWEHVWIEKIHFSIFPNYREEQTQRFFDEIIHLGGFEYVNHSRFYKYFQKNEVQNKNN